jgi:hypothetical protein
MGHHGLSMTATKLAGSRLTGSLPWGRPAALAVADGFAVADEVGAGEAALVAAAEAVEFVVGPGLAGAVGAVLAVGVGVGVGLGPGVPVDGSTRVAQAASTSAPVTRIASALFIASPA